MGFGYGQMVKVWSVDTGTNDRYCTVALSASQKDRDSGEYKVTFSSKFVRFIGRANDRIRKMEIPEKGVDIIMGYDDSTQYKAKDGTYKESKTVRTFSTIHWENKKPVPDDDDWCTDPWQKADALPAKAEKTEEKKSQKKSSAHTDDGDLPF